MEQRCKEISSGKLEFEVYESFLLDWSNYLHSNDLTVAMSSSESRYLWFKISFPISTVILFSQTVKTS